MRYRTNLPRKIAVVPAGYADGLDTRLGNRGCVLVRGRRVPIVGAVSMDMVMIDVTDVDVEMSPGDEVVILGEQDGERMDAREMAAAIGTIPWELLCRIGTRIERVYEEGAATPGNERRDRREERSLLPRFACFWLDTSDMVSLPSCLPTRLRTMKAPRTVFVCQDCGAQASKWMGRCADCGAWNSFVEERAADPKAAAGGARARPAARRAVRAPATGNDARRYADIDAVSTLRLTSGIRRVRSGARRRNRSRFTRLARW